jgi:arsenate reductase (thioredoxin)
MTRHRVLVLCTGNSARSQMAEGLLRHDFGDRVEVESAGTHPGTVRPEAIAVMREIGIDISSHQSKHVDELRDRPFDYVLTVCDRAAENCPIFPGPPVRLHRDFPDPVATGMAPGERLSVFRSVRDDLRRYLSEWMASLPNSRSQGPRS